MSGSPAQRVLFICDFGRPFSGADFRVEGVGGTESCVVLLAEAYAARGASVVVANRVTDARVDAGVRYVPLSALDDTPADTVILWKQWSDAAAGRGGTRLFFWTDVHMPDPAMLGRCREWAQETLLLSEFQRQHLVRGTRGGRTTVVGAPVAVGDYGDLGPPKERLLLYCSVPDRGLYYLKDLFPRIRRRVPDARLAITSDFTLWGAQPAKAAFMKFFAGQDGVEYRGHVSRPELVTWQRRARVMAYPCRFEEGFCLAAAECMAAGAVPVTTRDYALVTTVADGGVLVGGHPRGFLYRRRFVNACVELLTDDTAWRAVAERGRARAVREYAPDACLDRILAVAARL
jgi:glycosyltransferase involved in cell wall biosynthesis